GARACAPPTDPTLPPRLARPSAAAPDMAGAATKADRHPQRTRHPAPPKAPRGPPDPPAPKTRNCKPATKRPDPPAPTPRPPPRPPAPPPPPPPPPRRPPHGGRGPHDRPSAAAPHRPSRAKGATRHPEPPSAQI